MREDDDDIEYSEGRKRNSSLNPGQIIIVSFIGIILLGTILLALPISAADRVSVGLYPAFFSSVSATCVTGLSTMENWEIWSRFGKVVVFILIEIGGLGFMSATALVLLIFGKKINMRKRMVIAQLLNLNDLGDIMTLQKWVLKTAFAVQTGGALILSIRLIPQFGFLKGMKLAVFHAVSSFCNAGIQIFATEIPGYASDPVISLTMMVLIITGGLGFFVLQDVAKTRKWSKFSAYTKLVLIVTPILILSGGCLICLLEWNNPQTLGLLSPGGKILNGFFQAVDARTCGFGVLDQSALTEASKAATAALMMIGGSSSSTAGGIKTVTIAVMVLYLAARAQGNRFPVVFHRKITADQVIDAMTVTGLMTGMALIGCIFISVSSQISLPSALMSSIAALSTAGLCTVPVTALSIGSQILLMLYMFFGRVGLLTISLGFLEKTNAEDRINFPDANIPIG